MRWGWSLVFDVKLVITLIRLQAQWVLCRKLGLHYIRME